MSEKKAKAFFKKWLEVEKRVGDEEGQDTVKRQAREWMQKSVRE